MSTVVLPNPEPSYEVAPVRQTAVKPAKHIPALDGLRGMAILLVTLYRFTVHGSEANPSPAFEFAVGTRGVDLFFVLSGFLITGILYDARGERHFFRDFYMRRSLRIWPLYYGVLLAVLVVAPWFSATMAQLFSAARNHEAWLWLYGANLLNAYEGAWCLGRFDHFWSLAVEEHFYLIWPLVIFFCSRRTSLWLCGAMIVLAPIARAGWLVCGGNSTAAEVFTLFRVDALAVGAWIALAMRSPNPGVSLPERWAGNVLALSTLLLLPVVITNKRLLYLPETIYALFFGAVLVYAVTLPSAHRITKFWSSRPLRFLGKYSYAMYVFQSLLIPVAALWFTVGSLSRWCGSDVLGETLYVAIMFATTVVVSLLSWNLFEKHFLALKRYFGGEHNVVPAERVNHAPA